MLLNPRRTAAGILIVAAAGACGPATAEQTTLPDENAVKLDQSIQSLKDEVLQFNREAQTAEQDVLYPSQTRVSVFLGVRVSALLIKDISIAFDDGGPQKLSYTDNQAKSFLQNNGIHRMLLANLAPGSHRIRAEFSARFADDKPDAAPITGSYEAIFDKGYREAELELVLARSSRLSKPTLSLKQWRKVR